MDNFSLIKALFHGVDFYWKKFFVLSLFLLTILGGFSLWRHSNVSEASSNFADVPEYSYIQQKTIDIQVLENGKVTIDGVDSSSSLKLFSDHDEIRIILLDNPNVFIQSLTAKVTLPQSFKKNEIEQITYAVHGVGSYRNYVQDDRVLVYEASDITVSSTYTIVAKIPKGMVHPPLLKRVSYFITSIPAKSYLILAFILPLVTLCVTLFMLVKRRKDQIISLSVPALSQPPAAVNPAVVGVLIDGQVGSREIAATLIDLAERKFIYIIKKGEGFTFGKRKAADFETSNELKPFEKMLLSKIFTNSYRSTKEDVEMRVGHHIFSRKIAQMFLEIYDETTRAGYFIKNPASVHRRWRFAGIALFFLSLLGFAQSAVYAPDPKFTLLFWVGSMAAAAVIIKIAGMMPARSKEGSQALGFWMGFRKYLKMNADIPESQLNASIFAQNLPYAIVFGVEDAWAKRFMKEVFNAPDWYDSDTSTNNIEDFIGGLYPLISFVGDILAKSHDPIVE